MTAAICTSAAAGDDDRLHPEPTIPGVGIAHKGASLEKLQEAIRLNPKSAQAYLERGDAYLSDTETEKALADFNKAIELDPRCGKAYIGKYFVLVDDRRKDEALASLKKAMEIGPADLAMDALYLQASLHKDLGLYPQAMTELTQVIKSNLFSKRRLAKVYLQRGMVNDRMQAKPAAISDYTNAIKLNPDFGKAYLFRANDYSDIREFKKADDDYKVVERNVIDVPTAKRKYDFDIVKADLFHFRAEYFKRINRPDLARISNKARLREERQDVDISPFQSR